MKTYLFSDSHLNHSQIATYCDRPENFTDLIELRWNQVVKPEDLVIHLGDFAIGGAKGLAGAIDILNRLNGRKVLVRGNHDKHKANTWWMTHCFDFACDSMVFRSCWLTHEPAKALPEGCILNLHGHLHNIWHGFHPNASVDPAEEAAMKLTGKPLQPWQRLFACEYTNYSPIEFERFVSHPDKFYARGLNDENLSAM